MREKTVSICQKIIEYSFCLLFFLTPLIFYRSTHELFEFPKMLFVYVTTTTIAAAFITKSLLRGKLKIPSTPLDIPLALFLSASLLSTIFSLDKYTSLFGYYTRFYGGFLSILSYISLYYIFLAEFDFKKWRDPLLYLLFISTFIISSYALLQRLGLDKKFWVQDSQARVFSTLGQPNWLAAYLVIIIPVLLGVLIIEKNKKSKLFLCFVLFFSFLAFYFTLSRSGFLALLVVLAVFFAFLRHRSVPKNFRILLPILGVFALLSVLTSNQISGRLLETAKDIKLSEGGSTGEIRFLVWKGTLDLALKSPFKRQLLGYGPGTFAYAFLPFRPRELNRTSEWEFLYNKPHNEFLDVLANLGIIGLFAFLFFITKYCLQCLRILKDDQKNFQEKTLSAGLFSGWLSILITSFFGFIVVPTALLFWLFPALSFSLTENDSFRVIKKEFKTIQKKIAIFGVIGLSICSLLGISRLFLADIAYAKGRDLLRGGLYEPAADHLKKAVNLNPKEPRYSRDLAQTYTALALISQDEEIKKLSLKQANEQAIAAIKLNPRNSLTLRSVINTYSELGRVDPLYFDKAEELTNFAVEYIPTDPVLRYIKGKVLLAKGEKEASLRAFGEASALKEDYREANYAKGLVLADLERFEEAAKLMEKIGELDRANKYREKIINN